MSKGIDFIIQINKGTEELPEWITVAGQRSGKLNRSVDTLDTTSKDSGSWKESEYGFREWSIDADGLLVEDDEGYKLLEDAYFNLSKLNIQMKTSAGNQYEGLALLTDFPVDAPYSDTAKYSMKFVGSGELKKKLKTT